jgi:2-hydroxychromene-2-carboxylate isomerase
LIAYDDRGFADGARLALALGRAMWAEGRNLEDETTLRGLLADVGLPPEWIERTHEPAIKAALAERTAAAQAAGVFGVPSFVVGGTAPPFGGAAGRAQVPAGEGKMLVWGQDRLELVMRGLGGWRPVHG